jgi:hypothetical protein
MRRGPGWLLGTGVGLALLVAPPLAATPPAPGPATVPATVGEPPGSSAPAPATPDPDGRDGDPRPFLIYLKDGSEPLVVERYLEEGGEVRFQKYGGWIGIPRSEILKIVRDDPAPESWPVLLPPAPRDPTPLAASAEPELYLTMKGGGNLKVTAIVPEGERVRVTVPDGSFTVARTDVVGLVRVPAGSEPLEAWISIVGTHRPEVEPPRVAASVEREPDRAADVPPAAVPAPPPAADPLVTEVPRPRLPYERSDRAHFVRLSNGQLMRLESFWVEDGQLRFQRFGGIIGVALAEIVRLIPEEIAPVPGRTQVRFVRQLGPDLLEVAVKSGAQRVRLLGIAPIELARTDESPWRHLEGGALVYLEFDRQRYDADGNWLAYVFLPSNRMLNAELVRTGLARPLADGRNLKYLDLFHELASGDLPDGAASAARAD